MLKIEQVIKQDRLLRALTGLNRKAFESLLPTFNEFYQQTITERNRSFSSVKIKNFGSSGIPVVSTTDSVVVKKMNTLR